MIMTDTHAFVRFLPPQCSAGDDWYIRSVEQDYDGNFWYLAFDGPVGHPMLAKIYESFTLTTTSEDEAHATLLKYYTFHGAPELYSAAVPVTESQVMNFI